MHGTICSISLATASSGRGSAFAAHHSPDYPATNVRDVGLRPAFSDAIAAASDELVVEVATTPEQIIEAQRLRYRVYCEERAFEHSTTGLEQDRFDAQSHHVIVRSRATRETLGTLRIIRPAAQKGFASLPMGSACEASVFASLPLASSGEVSRFALTRERSGISPAAAALMRLCLVRGAVDLSQRIGITHWCAIMEKTLLRLLRSSGVHLQPMGPVVEYHGLRQPAIASIDAVLNRMYHEQPAIWAYVTNNGTFWPNNELVMKAAS